MKTTRLINNCLIFSFILSLLLSLSSIELRSQDSDFYYELIGELPDYPAEGLWNPGSFELSSEPYFPIPDIDGNPPVKSDIQLFNK